MRGILQKRIYAATMLSDLLEVLNCVIKCIRIREALHTAQGKENVMPIKKKKGIKKQNTIRVRVNQTVT